MLAHKSEAGKYDAAIEKYKEVLQQDSTNATALYELSYSLLAKGDPQQCIRYASAGLKQKSPYAWNLPVSRTVSK